MKPTQPKASPVELYTQHAQDPRTIARRDLDTELQFSLGPQYFNDTQLTALDLYERGLNVIPLKPRAKKPYILRPFFFARLHHCGDCKHGEDMRELFGQQRNIGIITGRTSGNLLDIDCDTDPAFEKMGQELNTRTIPYWAIKGTRGGSYLVRIIEGEAVNIAKRKSIIEGVEFFGNRHIRVMPPSIHPSGKIYQWVTPEPRFSLPARETIPAVSIDVLTSWTGITLLKDTRKRWREPELFGLPEWAAMLSYNNRQTFTGAVSEGDRNSVLTAFVYDMKGNGIDYYEAERVTLDYARRTGLKRREALDTLKSAYAQDREPARKGGGELRAWQRAKDFGMSFHWRGSFGRQALTAQAVFLACVERARLEGREHWRASVREVAELANCNKETAAAYLRDLQPHFIQRTNPNQPREVAIYRFCYVSNIRTLETTCSYSVRNLDNPKTQAELDLFSLLGRVAWQVWKHLQTKNEPTIAAIAKAIQTPRTSIYPAMQKLARPEIALIGRGSDGAYYAESKTDASLQYLTAQLFNGASPSQNRKAKHKIDRERDTTRALKNAIAWHEGKA